MILNSKLKVLFCNVIIVAGFILAYDNTILDCGY